MDRDGNGLKLAVRRAPMPYFRPFVIVNLSTNEVVGHYQTEGDAKVALARMHDGAIRVKASAIQPTGDVHKALEARTRTWARVLPAWPQSSGDASSLGSRSNQTSSR